MIRFIFLTLLAAISSMAFSQENDFCYNSKDTSQLITALCFEKTIDPSIETLMSHQLDPYTKGVCELSSNGVWVYIPNSYIITQFDNILSGVTRVSFDAFDNLRFIVAIIPHDVKGDVKYAQIGVIIIRDGESQILTKMTCLKEKITTGENISLYKITPVISDFKIDGELKSCDINVFLKDGQYVDGIKIGNTTFKIR
jgi:hypothetical protein